MPKILAEILHSIGGPVLTLLVKPVLSLILSRLDEFLQTEEKTVIATLRGDIQDFIDVIDSVAGNAPASNQAPKAGN